MKKIYKQIAEEHGVTPEEVERDIALAIERIYLANPDHEVFKNGIPSNKKFIKHTANRIN